MCHEAGLVKLGVVALDGTKVAANVPTGRETPTGATGSLKKKYGVCWPRRRLWTRKRTSATVLSSEGTNSRRDWGGMRTG